MRLATHQQALIDELMHLHDPQERLSAVVDRSRKARLLATGERTADHRVPGCSSQVWLRGELRDGRCYFRVDAESPLIRGLVVLLADFFSDARPEEIAAADNDPLETLDLNRTLTPTRRQGLAAVRAAIRRFAEAHRSADPSTAPAAGPAS